MAKHPSFDDFARGTVLSEANVEIAGAKFEYWDYAGHVREAVPALHITFRTTDGDAAEQFYSAGKPDDFNPSKDGKTLDIISDRERIHEQSQFAIFMTALFKAGFPKTRVDNDDIGCLVGTRGHVKQETIKRTGGNVKAETSILVFDKVSDLPGESKSSSASSGIGGGDSEEYAAAAGLVQELLAEAGGSMERKQLLPLAIKSDTYKAMSKTMKTAVLNLVKKDEFIQSGDSWSLDDKGTLTLG